MDNIYRELEKVDVRPDPSPARKAFVDDEDRKPRSKEEMSTEALMLTKLFPKQYQVEDEVGNP